MDALISAVAELQAATAEAASQKSTHQGQVRVLDRIARLVVELKRATVDPTKARETAERALRDVVLGDFGAREGALTLALQYQLRSAWATLYELGDSRNMLSLASEFQEVVGKKSKSEMQSVALMRCLEGMTRSRGKALAGHFPQTLAVAQGTLEPRSHQVLKLVASVATNSVSAPTTGSPLLRVAAVEAMMEGLSTSGNDAKYHAPVFKILQRASTVKSSNDVRVAGARGLLRMTTMCDPCTDKTLVQSLLPLLHDVSSVVRRVAGEALGLTLSKAKPSTFAPASALAQQPKTLETLTGSFFTLHDATESLCHAYHYDKSQTTQSREVLAVALSAVLTQTLVNTGATPASLAEVLDSGLRLAWPPSTSSSSSSTTTAIEPNARDATDFLANAASVLRSLGSRFPEREQLASVRHLLLRASTRTLETARRRVAIVELSQLMATLGQAVASVEDLRSRLLALAVSRDEPDQVRLEASAALRTYLISAPKNGTTISLCTSELLEALALEKEADRVGVLVFGLSAVVRAAASLNNGNAARPLELFGMGKALASRVLDFSDNDPTLRFTKAGWDLLASLLCLGPAFWGPHLPQLFSLWDEALKSGQPLVQESACRALATLLRNSEASSESEILSRAALALLEEASFDLSVSSTPSGLTPEKPPSSSSSQQQQQQHHHNQQQPQTKLASLHAAVLEAASMVSPRCNPASKVLDTALTSLALTYLDMGETSLLDPGGLLNPNDDFLESDADHSPIRPIVSLVENVDAWRYATEWHSLASRRAQERPSHGSRLAAAASGRAVSDVAPIPLPSARGVAPGPLLRQRVTDAAIAYLGTLFAREDHDSKHRLLVILAPRLTPHGTSVAKSATCAILNALRTIQLETTVAVNQTAASWHGACRDALLLSINSPHGGVRRASGHGLALLSKLCANRLEIQMSISGALELHLMPAADTPAVENARMGAALAAAMLKREGLIGPNDSLVFEACKQATGRVWTLHALSIVLGSIPLDTAQAYVKPTTALVVAHALADCGPHVEGGLPALLCVSRLLNGVVTALGPEIAGDDDRTEKLFSVWQYLVQASQNDPSIMHQCVKFIESLAMFHRAFLSDPVRAPIVVDFVERAFSRSDSSSVLTSALTCALRLAERNTSLVPRFRAYCFMVSDAYGRFEPPTDRVALVVSGMSASVALRKEWVRADMTGAAGRFFLSQGSVSVGTTTKVGAALVPTRRWTNFYPPDIDEQVCFVVSELIKVASGSELGDWFEFCAAIVSGTSSSSGQSQSVSSPVQKSPHHVIGDGGRGDEEILDVSSLVASDSLRDSRWQTKCAALECVNAVVRRASVGATSLRTMPLSSKLETMLGCASQAATALVGDAAVPTLQSRGLASLGQIISIFALFEDPDALGEPVLRQHEIKLVATVKTGLVPGARPEVAREANALAASILVYGVAQSAKKVVALLIDSLLNSSLKKAEDDNNKNNDEDDDFLDDDPDSQEDSTTISSSLAVDEAAAAVDQSRVLLAKASALARLVLATKDRWGALGDDEIITGDRDLWTARPDTKKALDRALAPHQDALQRNVFYAVVRDYVVLDASLNMSGGGPPKRHPQALYTGGVSRQEVSLLLPAYRDSWAVAAQAAAAWIADTPPEELDSAKFKLLLLTCTRCVATDETIKSPLRSLYALRTLLESPHASNSTVLSEADRTNLSHVVVERALRAASRGRDRVLEACILCVGALLRLPPLKEKDTHDAQTRDLVGVLGFVLGSSASLISLKAVNTALACVGVVCQESPVFAPLLLTAVTRVARLCRSETLTAGLGRAFVSCGRVLGGDSDFLLGALKDALLAGDARSVLFLEAVSSACGVRGVKQLRPIATESLRTILETGSEESVRILLSFWGKFGDGRSYYVAACWRELCKAVERGAPPLETFQTLALALGDDSNSTGSPVQWDVVVATLADALVEISTTRELDFARDKRIWGSFLLSVARHRPEAFKVGVTSISDPRARVMLEETVRGVVHHQQ